jgi:hypothetical protein
MDALRAMFYLYAALGVAGGLCYRARTCGGALCTRGALVCARAVEAHRAAFGGALQH